MTITETTTVAAVAAAVPDSVAVFQAQGIDFCCGGARALGDVCRERGIRFSELAAAIEEAQRHSTQERADWQHEPLHALIDHIIETYHKRLREELPRLHALAVKVRRAHGDKTPDVARLEDLLTELSTGLIEHMGKEEAVLFPAIRNLEGGDMSRTARLTVPVQVMEQEHEHAGVLLAELRGAANDYQVPDWGCGTVRALYRGLEDMERSMHVHVHLENNILFPRALRLTESFGLVGTLPGR